jgi:outer membrane protein OmpA-like peptidoglycan-associated protein
MSVVFAFYSSALSNSTRSALIDLSRKLARGASVTIVGYADFDIPLATSRANAVKKFLQGLVPVKVKIEIVTNLPIRKVKVINTAT